MKQNVHQHQQPVHIVDDIKSFFEKNICLSHLVLAKLITTALIVLSKFMFYATERDIFGQQATLISNNNNEKTNNQQKI